MCVVVMQHVGNESIRFEPEVPETIEIPSEVWIKLRNSSLHA